MFSSRNFFLLFTSSFILTYAVSAYAQNGNCQPRPLAAINVKPIFSDPTLNLSKSLKEIQQMEKVGSNIIPHYDSVTLGIAHFEPVLKFKLMIISQEMPDKTYCVRVGQADAAFGYRNVTIFIGREIAADPCSTQHVLNHEKKHLSVNQKLLEEFIPMIREQLYSYFKLYGQFRTSDLNQAKIMLDEKIDSILKDMFEGMMKENQRRQRFVDTPEEYARNNTVCNGWINKLMWQIRANQK